MAGRQAFTVDPAMQEAEVRIKLTDLRRMPSDRSQSQRAACHLVLLHAESNPEMALALRVGERGEAFAQAHRTREDIYDRNTS